MRLGELRQLKWRPGGHHNKKIARISKDTGDLEICLASSQKPIDLLPLRGERVGDLLRSLQQGQNLTRSQLVNGGSVHPERDQTALLLDPTTALRSSRLAWASEVGLVKFSAGSHESVSVVSIKCG
jgi:hypothetical protein